MKRIILICVALVAFLATNASGTNNHSTNQKQTCYQDHPVVIMPALNVSEIVFVSTEVETNYFRIPANADVLGLFRPNSYCNPDYGLYSISALSYPQIKNIFKDSDKLPTQFVQLE